MAFWSGRDQDDLPNPAPRTFVDDIKDYFSSRLTSTLPGFLILRNPFSFTATQQPPQTQIDQTPISVVESHTTVEILPFLLNPQGIPLNPLPVAMDIDTEPADAYVSPDLAIFRSPSILQGESVADFFSIPIDEYSLSLPSTRTDTMHPMRPLSSGNMRPHYMRIVSFSRTSSSSRYDLPYFRRREEIQNSNPIILALRQNEFGKMMLTVVVPMVTGLLAIQNRGSSPLFVPLVAVALSFGFAATWNGVLLRQLFPPIADYIEQLGVASILVAFFGMVSSLFPVNLIWVPWLGCGLSFVPFVLPFFR